jgi:hypothetical protein
LDVSLTGITRVIQMKNVVLELATPTMANGKTVYACQKIMRENKKQCQVSVSPIGLINANPMRNVALEIAMTTMANGTTVCANQKIITSFKKIL